MIKEWWIEQHKNNVKLFLTGSSLEQVASFLELKIKREETFNVLNVGVGTGRCTKELFDLDCNVFVLDICQEALDKVKNIVTKGYLDPKDLPNNRFDLIISHLVLQHITDEVLLKHLIHFLRSIRKDGIIAMQFADCKGAPRNQSLEAQQKGGVLRSKEEMQELISKAEGKVVKWTGPKGFDHTPVVWHGIHIKREDDRNP